MTDRCQRFATRPMIRHMNDGPFPPLDRWLDQKVIGGISRRDIIWGTIAALLVVSFVFYVLS